MLRRRTRAALPDGDDGSGLGAATHRDAPPDTVGGHNRRVIKLALVVTTTLLVVCATSFVTNNLEVRGGGSDPESDDGIDVNRCENLLLRLCAGGPRHAGSVVAEVDTVKLLLAGFEGMEAEANAHGAQLEFETHHGQDQCFDTDFLNGFTNCYEGVGSVVVRLSWANQLEPVPAPALLINAHFDSFPSSPGAADNAVSVPYPRTSQRTRAPNLFLALI